MYLLEVSIDRFPRHSVFKELVKLAGKPIHDDHPSLSCHYVTFQYNTLEEAEVAEERLLESEVVNSTNIDEEDEDCLPSPDNV